MNIHIYFFCHLVFNAFKGSLRMCYFRSRLAVELSSTMYLQVL